MIWFGGRLYISLRNKLSGLAPSPASDVYSLGVVLYEALTGQTPFYSEDISELAMMHREKAPLPPRYLDPDIPESLQKIIMRALSKDSSSRYRNGDQFGRVLQSFCDQAKISTPYSIYAADTEISNWDSQPASEIDWRTIGLAFVTLFLVSGLIPLWIYIILRYGNVFQ